MLTKEWQCPTCGREFIVARDTERDTCPWCKTTVQERAGSLEKAAGAPPSPGTTSTAPSGPSASPGANPSGGPSAGPSGGPGPTPNPSPGAHPGVPGSGPQPATPQSPGSRTTGEMWWPYEYDPF